MRLTLDPRARHLLARVPRVSWFAMSELILLTVLAWAVARLAWAIVTPLGPVGAWRPAMPAGGAAAQALGSFDPFFRSSPDGGTAAVTPLNLKLYGVRADQATGRGSAIIALPDGTQASVAVGEEVVPGVRLEAVRFDGVTLLRGGAREQLFLDQSGPATSVGGAPPVQPPPPPAAVMMRQAGGPGYSPMQLQGEVSGTPRLRDGRVDGFVLQPRGSGEAFRTAGLQPGDVLLAVNGSRMTNPESLSSLPQLLAAGGGITLEVERGGQTLTLMVGR